MAISVTVDGALAGQAGRGATSSNKVLCWGDHNLGTYATNGVAVAASDFTTALNAAGYPGTVSSIDRIACCGNSGDLSTYGAHDTSNEKIVAYVRSTDAEVSNATDLSAAAKHIPFWAVLTMSY